MSVFDCHVNRAPVEGRVRRVAYHPGAFLSADLDKASEDNERNGVVIENAAGQFGVVQIAGLVARRIVCFTQEGAHLAAGDRFGLIRFGSRVDVYLPDEARVIVGLRRARGGGRDGDRRIRPRRPAAPASPELTGMPAADDRTAAAPTPPTRPRPGRARRFRAVPLRLLIPNLVTLLALCLGLTAIRFAFEGSIEWAVSAIAAAAVLDGLDGRIARALKGTSRFGAELELARRFRRLRRRAGRRALCLRPRRDEEPRLADGAGLRHRLRAAAGALQRDARRSRRCRRGASTSSSACRPRRARSSACCRSICACC